MTPSRTLQPEIQGLRAIAVGLVVIFHIWPNWLAGGYVGVDVFFVISGYLITGLLARAAERDGRVSLLDFYSRRARRLLPAATLVLTFAFVGMFFLLPEARWEETVIQIAASALYIQNWVLAWLSVDYLGAEQAASPVQHYWSLAIEEQFYFIWPWIMIGCLFLARHGLSRRRIFTFALAAIFTASLAASVYFTAQQPQSAYFVTYTRAWELALGGLLALTIHRISIESQWLRAALLIAGLAAIVGSAAVFTEATAFPGIAALVPTVGAVLVLLAGDVRLGAFKGLNAIWLGYIGDRSYSIYLWHWPLVVFYTVRVEIIDPMAGLGILALALVLSHLCYEHVEQRFRHPGKPREWRPLGMALASICMCLLAAGSTIYLLRSQSVSADAGTDLYPGPAALLADASVPLGVDTLPSLANLKRDLPVVYGLGCHQNQESAEPISCTLGDPNGTKTMVITGDSHAANWIPALDIVARDNGWKLVTFTKSACAFSRVEVQVQGKPYTACMQWRENALAKIKEIGAEVMFTSQSRYGYIEDAEMAAGLTSVWQELIASGVRVVPIQDTPWMPFEPGDCLQDGDFDLCTAPRAEVVARDVFYQAASALSGVKVVDLVDAICDPQTCFSVVGNVIVWRDPHHLTATFAAALAPYLAQQAGFEVHAAKPISSAALHPGAAALVSGLDVPAGAELRPALASLKRDLPVVYEMGCHQDQEDAEPKSCELGDTGASRTIVLIGDSHAAQWVPALAALSEDAGYRLVSFTKSACPYARVEARRSGNLPYPSCEEWRERVLDEIAKISPDYVVTAQLRRGGSRELLDGMRATWADITATGAEIIALKDTPRVPFEPGDCLAIEEDCFTDRASAEAPDVEVEAAKGMDGVRVVDMTDTICGSERCDAVVGNVIVYRDPGHMTATYSATLAPYLRERMALGAP